MNKPIIKKIVIVSILLLMVIGFAKERSENSSSNNSNVVKSSSEKGSIFQSLVGKPAPAFALTDKQGNALTNDNLKGKNVVLFFNEGLACYPACWEQMLEFAKDERFKQSDTVVYSVITDSESKWQQALEKMSDLSIINVGFDKGKVSKDFGADNVASTMHPGQPGHSYVIIDKNGVVRFVYDDPKMAVNNDKIYNELSKLQ